MAREIQTDNNYQSKLLKLIPSEIIAAYMVITGIIPEEDKKWGLLIITIILFIIIPFYLLKVQKVKNKLQITATSIAFIVWTYSLNGGALNAWGLYQSWIASIVLIIWTLIMPMFITSKKV